MEEVLSTLRQWRATGESLPNPDDLEVVFHSAVSLRRRQQQQQPSEFDYAVEVVEILFSMLPSTDARVLGALGHLVRLPSMLKELRTHRKSSLDLAIRNLCTVFLEKTPVESMSCLSHLLLSEPRDRRAAKVFSASSLTPILSIVFELLRNHKSIECCCDVLVDLFSSDATVPHVSSSVEVVQRVDLLRAMCLRSAETTTMWEESVIAMCRAVKACIAALQLTPLTITQQQSGSGSPPLSPISNVIQWWWCLSLKEPLTPEPGIVWFVLFNEVSASAAMCPIRSEFLMTMCFEILSQQQLFPGPIRSHSLARFTEQVMSTNKSSDGDNETNNNNHIVRLPSSNVESDVRIVELSQEIDRLKEQLSNRDKTLESTYMKLVLLSKAYKELEHKYEIDVKGKVAEYKVRTRSAQEETASRDNVISNLQQKLNALESKISKFSELHTMIHKLTGEKTN
eukprot:PhM_4_TR14105/c1_g1_i4/m.95377